MASGFPAEVAAEEISCIESDSNWNVGLNGRTGPNKAQSDKGIRLSFHRQTRQRAGRPPRLQHDLRHHFPPLSRTGRQWREGGREGGREGAEKLLALPPLVALLELPQPAAPQVLPGDEQAPLVRHHAALPGGVVVGPQEQVLPARLDLGAFARHVLGAHPQQLVAAADAVLALFVDGDDVDARALGQLWGGGEKPGLDHLHGHVIV
ncbi:hypothetical protein EYF80_030719 [Liparis tanakae]|uniref:Uncharacterized protein n=1 Tax=Liparis tanakae TaxID=230148 RepID=A0A4Z2H172_9TELE|nr:hypothetical protein EYF80_030719 [Liparis tanakae]